MQLTLWRRWQLAIVGLFCFQRTSYWNCVLSFSNAWYSDSSSITKVNKKLNQRKPILSHKSKWIYQKDVLSILQQKKTPVPLLGDGSVTSYQNKRGLGLGRGKLNVSIRATRCMTLVKMKAQKCPTKKRRMFWPHNYFWI